LRIFLGSIKKKFAQIKKRGERKKPVTFLQKDADKLIEPDG
jgi:hypothetical protein